MKYYFKEDFTILYDKGALMDADGHVVYDFESTKVFLPCLQVYKYGHHIGEVRERLRFVLGHFDIEVFGEYNDSLVEKLTFIRPKLLLEERGWEVKGDLMKWNYEITDREGLVLCDVHEEIFHWTKHFTVDIYDEENADALIMIVLAVYLFDKEADAAAAAA